MVQTDSKSFWYLGISKKPWPHRSRIIYRRKGPPPGLQRSQLTDAMVEMCAELFVLIPYPFSLTPIGMKCLCPLWCLMSKTLRCFLFLKLVCCKNPFVCPKSRDWNPIYIPILFGLGLEPKKHPNLDSIWEENLAWILRESKPFPRVLWRDPIPSSRYLRIVLDS